MDLFSNDFNRILMLTKKLFAEKWIADWNSHDLDRILAHYSDDVEITSPMIKIATGRNQETIKGKSSVASYWQTALQKIPDLHFELIDVAEGVDSVALYYKSVMNNRSIELMFFDEDGKVNKIFAHYTNLP